MKKIGDIHIGKVRGDVVVSNHQQGGVTTNSIDPKAKPGRNIWKVVLILISILAGLTQIFTWMHWFPFNEPKGQRSISVNVPKPIFQTNIQTSHLITPRKAMFKSNKEENEKGIKIGTVSGDVVISQDQRGGITAHTVIVSKTPNRIIQTPIELIGKLKLLKPVGYRLQYSATDNETISIANAIDSVLQASGWKNVETIKQIFPPYDNGIQICSIKQTAEVICLADYLWFSFHKKGVTSIYLKDFKNIFTVDGRNSIELPLGMDGVVISIGPNTD